MVSEILDNADKIIENIREQTKLSDYEIKEKIQKKQDQYGGLLNEGGAAYSVAKELNVKTGFEPKPMQIRDLKDGMNNVRLVVTVKRAFPLNEFERSGKQGCVQNLVVKDDSGECKLALWNKKELSEAIKPDVILTIENAYTKDNNGLEVHLGNYGNISIEEEKPKETKVDYQKLSDMKEKQQFSFKGKITGILQTHEFTRGAGKGRVRTMTITDGSDTGRFVFWNDKVDLLDELKENQEIEVKNAMVRENRGQLELHYIHGTEITSKD